MCQVVMESNYAENEIMHAEGFKTQAPLCTTTTSSSSPPPHHHITPPASPTLQSSSSIPFNLRVSTSPSLKPHAEEDCSPLPPPGSPQFFLPANACIALDDPSSSSFPTSYSSPSSDTNSLWPHSLPPHPPAFLDCPSLFSTAGSFSQSEAAVSFYCDQIPTLVPNYAADGTAADSSDNRVYDPSFMRLLQSSSVYGHQSAGTLMNSSHYSIMQGSDHPYSYSGSAGPFGSAYSSSADYGHLHHNAARARIDFTLANRALYPHDGRVNMLHHGIVAASSEQEHSWHNFLQHNVQDEPTEIEVAAHEGQRSTSTNAALVMEHQHQLAAHSLRVAHPGMPMINHSMGNPNAGSLSQQQMQLTGLQERDTTLTSSIKIPNKRRVPDGEGQDSWPPAAANACSPPLKMMRSPSFSSSTTPAPDLHIHNASPNFINSYKFGGAATSCNSGTALSPSIQKTVLTPSGSPTNQPHDPHHQKRPTKASTRQSVCNDPQSVAARHRRERISERLKTLQQLVPNGSKVDLVTMLEKAISYVKSLQLQVKVLSTDEYWPTPLSDKYSLNNLAVVAKLAASTYS